MAADVEASNIPLESSKQKDPPVDNAIKTDNDTQLRKLIREYGVDRVWQSRPQVAHILNSFHKCGEAGALKCLEVLFEFSPPKEIFDAPNYDGKSPLMIAGAKAQLEAAKLLIEKGADINSRNNKGESALHILAHKISEGSKHEEALLNIADSLLSHPDIDLEPHDKNGLTPLDTAAEKLPPREISQKDETPSTGGLTDFCRKLVNKGASLTANAKSERIKEVLEWKQLYTEFVMHQELRQAPPRPSASEFLDMIILGNVSRAKAFLRRQNAEDARNAANSKIGSKSLLFYAIDVNNKSLVEVLLAFGADLSSEITKEPPVHRAAARGYYEIFNLFIERMKGEEETLDMRGKSFKILQIIIENSAKLKDKSEDINHLKCLARMMEKDVIIDLNEKKNDQTILHIAAAFSHQEAMSKLLQHGAFLGAPGKVFGKGYDNILPILLPGTLERAMDGCITHNRCTKDESEAENLFSDDFTLKLDYRFLMPSLNTDDNQETKKTKEMETLMEINNSNCHFEVIKHPLIQALLYAKWHKTFPLYILNVSIYFIFTILLTCFAYRVKDLRLLQERANNMSKIELSKSTLEEDIEKLDMTVTGLRSIVMLMNLYMLIREITQIVITWKTYIRNIENYLEWFLMTVVLVLGVTPLSVSAIRYLAALVMIVAWYEFVLLLGRIPILAIYITMLRHVSWNFFKLICVYGFLILAFTFSFNIILQPATSTEETDFSTFWSTLPKTIVMATGEFEYSDLNEQFFEQTIGHIVFIVFLFLMFLVVMNVMVGLAVIDTQEVVEMAKLHSLSCRLVSAYRIESLMLSIYRLLSFMGLRWESLVNRFQILTGDQNNNGVLYAKVNKTSAKSRLQRNDKSVWQLSDKVAKCLRSHHVHHLEEENKKRHGDSMNQEEGKKHCGDMMNQCLRILEEVQQRLQNAQLRKVEG